jgi:hypothetical protein
MCAALVLLQRLQEGRDGLASLRELVQKVVHGIASGLRLGKEAPGRNDHDKFPPTDWFIRQWSGGIMPP